MDVPFVPLDQKKLEILAVIGVATNVAVMPLHTVLVVREKSGAAVTYTVVVAELVQPFKKEPLQE